MDAAYNLGEVEGVVADGVEDEILQFIDRLQEAVPE